MLATGSVLSGIYRRVATTGLGEGIANAFAGLDVTDGKFYQLGAGPGDRTSFRGITIRIVRVRGAAVAAAGTALKRYLGGTGRTGTLAAGSTAAVVNTTSTFADNDIGDAFFQTTGGTGPNQFRPVREFDSSANATITVAKRDYAHDILDINTPDKLNPVPDNTTTFSLYAPWEVTPTAAAAGELVSCISLGAVTQDNWTLVVEAGLVPHLVVGTTDALVANSLVVPNSVTAGTGKGPLAAGITALEASRAYGLAIDAYSGSSALRLIELFGRFKQ